MKNTYFIILCGGDGQRLWPLSRKKRPKQLIPFLEQKSLLEQAVLRISEIAESKNNIVIVTNKDQYKDINKLVGKSVGLILSEDAKRNTAPAILYATLKIYEKDKDAVIVFLPADSFVVEGEKYVSSLNLAAKFAMKNKRIVTLGVMPTRPAIGYGYIQAKKSLKEVVLVDHVYEVEKFHEKPSLEVAQIYLQNDSMLWNISVFAARAHVFIEEFNLHAPKIYSQMIQYLEQKIDYEQITSDSIDFAIMEKSKKISIIPCDFAWYDVGNLDVFLTLQNKISKKNTKVINIEGRNNIVSIVPKKINKEKLVTFIGVSDLCLVEDEDVILVAKRSDVEKVKKVLTKIKRESLEQFL
jgi:mannose-1-phosphate guanylyltransferase / mannose-6-phosphate isomerase